MNLPFFKLLLDLFSVPTLVNGQLVVNGSSAVPISKTLAQFLALNTGTLADGAVIHITDVHGPSGAGGVYVTWDANAVKWGQNFGTPWVFTTVAVADGYFPAASYPGWRIRSSTYNLDYYSDGTEYVLTTGIATVSRSNVATNTLVVPAATFTSAAVVNNGGTVDLDTTSTSGGAHGLTQAVTVTAGDSYIYVAGGTGWTVGFHKITSIPVDTTGKIIRLATSYSGGLGTPTIVLAGSATVVPMLALTVPPLTKNGSVILSITPIVTNSTNAKNLKIRLNSTEFFAPTLTSSSGMPVCTDSAFEICNRNNVAINKATTGYTSYNGFAASSFDGNSGTVVTSEQTTLNVYYNPSTANERCCIDRYRLSIRS